MKIKAVMENELSPAVSVCSAEMGLTPQQFITACVVTGIKAMADYDPVIASAVARYGFTTEQADPADDTKGIDNVPEYQR